ncbi:MAG: glycine betaine/L-proline ABC transporter substrate-binding protein ProX [Microcoleaceae cyanobacterium]
MSFSQLSPFQWKSSLKQATLLPLFISCLVGLNSCQSQSPVQTEAINSERPGEGITVQGAYIGQEGKFVEEIVSLALSELGYQTAELKQLEPPLIHTAISQGDLDYFSGYWQILFEDFFQRSGGEEQLERIGTLVPNVLQGYQIDKTTAEKYNITNLEQLKNPEIAQLFDTDNDGKANLTGCNPGWGCEAVIEHHLNVYELEETVEHDQGSYEALIANTVARYRQGKPVLYYTWTPYWLGVELKPGEDVIWLEVPFTDLPGEQSKITAEETSANGKNLGFAVDTIQILANQQFIEANPTAKRLFEVIEIPLTDINTQNQRIKNGEDTPEDIRRHAEEWVENNQQQFDSWIETARNK